MESSGNDLVWRYRFWSNTNIYILIEAVGVNKLTKGDVILKIKSIEEAWDSIKI